MVEDRGIKKKKKEEKKERKKNVNKELERESRERVMWNSTVKKAKAHHILNKGCRISMKAYIDSYTMVAWICVYFLNHLNTVNIF